MKITLAFAFVLGVITLRAQDNATSKIDTTKSFIPVHDARHYSNRELRKMRPLVLVDGEEKSLRQLQRYVSSTDTSRIKIEIVKGQEAIDRFGKKGKYGAILLATKTPAH